jgi:hypothetical protein
LPTANEMMEKLALAGEEGRRSIAQTCRGGSRKEGTV